MKANPAIGLRRALLAAAAVLAAACASLPPSGALAPGAAGAMAGRFSLSITRPEAFGPDRSEAWTGRFSLVASGDALSLDLVSPLGATIARFESDPGEARLMVPADGGVRMETGADLQSLSERVLGWSLPVDGMPDWIAGHPVPGRPFHPLQSSEAGPGAAQGELQRFEQDGWTVSLERFEGGKGPRRVQMDRAARDGEPAVALRVVLDPPAAPADATGEAK